MGAEVPVVSELVGKASSPRRRERSKESIRVDSTHTASGIVSTYMDWVAYSAMDRCKVAVGLRRVLGAHVAQTTRRDLLLEVQLVDEEY